MSLWTTSTTGLETALAAAIGSTIQQQTNTITNNLKGQPHSVLHIGSNVGSNIATNLHNLKHSGHLHSISTNSINHYPNPLNHHTNTAAATTANLNLNGLCRSKYFLLPCFVCKRPIPIKTNYYPFISLFINSS